MYIYSISCKSTWLIRAPGWIWGSIVHQNNHEARIHQDLFRVRRLTVRSGITLLARITSGATYRPPAGSALSSAQAGQAHQVRAGGPVQRDEHHQHAVA